MIVCLYKKNETKKNRKFFILKKIEHRSFFSILFYYEKKLSIGVMKNIVMKKNSDVQFFSI